MDGVATDSKAPKPGCRSTRTRYQRGCNLSNLRGNPEGICRQFEANPETVGCQNHPTGHLVYWSMLNVKIPHIRLVLGTSSLSPIRMGKQMSNIIPKIPKQNLFGCSPEFDFFSHVLPMFSQQPLRPGPCLPCLRRAQRQARSKMESFLSSSRSGACDATQDSAPSCFDKTGLDMFFGQMLVAIYSYYMEYLDS